MSMKHLLCLVLFVCFSCTEPNAKDMLGDDFRLYKHTPAWSLAKAVEDEDTTEISKQVLQMHISVDYRDPKYKQTLLMLATSTNKIESVKKLLREFGIRKGLKKLVISSKIRIFIGENQ